MLSASISSLQASVSKNRVHRRHVLASNPPLKVSSLPESLLQASNESSPRPGHVYVVGGGLGPVDHLTVKAARLLQGAEVCVYDDLGAQGPLELLPSKCERVYVGKRGGRQSIKQPEIDKLLVQLCLEGRRVVRLKGGCPSVFSRVSSEMAALTAAGCSFELVPGISSALGAPLMAGFPLTQKDLGNSFAVTSGHDLEQDWGAFNQIPTLVVLMAGQNLAQIGERLLRNGWAPDTPVCIIRSAGIPSEQQIWRSTLAATVDGPPKEKLSPCIVIFGKISELGLKGTDEVAASG